MLALAVSAIVLVLWWFMGLKGILALIALLIAATFVASSMRASARPPESQLGGAATLRLWAGEVLAAWSLFLCALPLERWLFARDHMGSRAAAAPVLLVHGYVNNAGALWRLRGALKRAGHSVHSVNLEPVYTDIDAYVPLLAARIAEVRSRHAGREVVLVCHSMGGLAARALLRHCARAGQPAGVALVVTLGTPHHGTALAQIEMSPNGRQMRLGSPWLAALAADEQGAWPCPLVSIFSRDDNIVVPQASAELNGARNRVVSGVGHISLPLNARVAAMVIEEIERAAAPEARSPALAAHGSPGES
ncbi:MAG: alpha/beta hydrolase [Burkholderiales bacterium]|nr:alpha/beta hydrolase [Burkholderiales bacterium]